MLLKNGYFIYLIGSFINILTITVVKYFWNYNFLSISELIFFKTLLIVILLTPLNIRNIKKIKKKDIKLLIAICLLSTLDTYLWYLGFIKVPVNNAIILLSLSPVITSVLAVFFLKERISSRLILSIFISFASVFLVYRAISDKFNIGYLYLFIDLITYGFIAIIIKKLSHYSSIFLVYIRMLFMLIFSSLNVKSNIEINSNIFIFISFICFISIMSLIEKICFTTSYRLVDVSKIQPFRFANIVFSCILSFIILDEMITIWQLLGCIGIFFAILIGNKKYYN